MILEALEWYGMSVERSIEAAEPVVEFANRVARLQARVACYGWPAQEVCRVHAAATPNSARRRKHSRSAHFLAAATFAS